MSELNPNKRIAESEGIDVPIMYVYLAGKISGNCINKCLSWRKQIIKHYANYKGKGCYPISFLDALNSKEADSIDELGLTSALPPKLIYAKDMLSVKKADVLIVNMDDMMEEGIEHLLEENIVFAEVEELEDAYDKLVNTIRNRRSNWGTTIELGWALWLQKPIIIIAGSKKAKIMLETHPFMRESSVVVENVEELLEKKWIQILYKSISSTIY